MKAVGYIRVSTEDQKIQDLSVPMQKKRIISYMESKGWECTGWYIDDGLTGKNLNRPNVQKLIKDAKAKKFDVIVSYKLDRISRNQQHIMEIINDVILANGLEIASVTENLDTSTPMGRAMIGIMAVFAQLEREVIVERVTEAKAEAAKQGRYNGGATPYGYIQENKTLIINEEQARVVRRIYDLYLKGTGSGEIAGLLNTEGIQTILGKQWEGAAIRRMLRKPVYAGLIEHKGKTYPGRHQAIITVEQLNEARGLATKRTPDRTPSGKGLIGGFVWCGECNARMNYRLVWTNNPTRPKKIRPEYVCYSKLRSQPYMVKNDTCPNIWHKAADIEDKIVAELRKYSIDKGLIEQVAKEFADNIDIASIERDIASCQKELAGIGKKMDRWYTAYENGAIESSDLTERTSQLRQRKQILENEISLLEDDMDKAKEQTLSVDNLIEMLSDFSALYDHATPDEQKLVVSSLVEKVAIYKDGTVKITFTGDLVNMRSTLW